MDVCSPSYSSSIGGSQITIESPKSEVVNFDPLVLRGSGKRVLVKWRLNTDQRNPIKWMSMKKEIERELDAVRAKKNELENMVAIDSLEKEFHSLVKRWNEETFHLSSLTKIYANPAYQRIMAMGVHGLPLVLKELQNNNGNWFYALKFMAGRDIGTGIDNFEDAKAAWLEWGYNHNYI